AWISPTLAEPITSIENPSNGTIKIHGVFTGNLNPGDVVTISGITTGQTAINGRWLVKTVYGTDAFDLYSTAIPGNGITTSRGSFSVAPSFVTFEKPTGYTPPTDNALHPFRFSVHLGTVVPTNITASVPQATPKTVITVSGKGLTGVYGVS